MKVDDVIEVLDRLVAAGVTVWLDGGWGVDALVGCQTRPHADLDLALVRGDLERAARALVDVGFNHEPAVVPGLPARYVTRDDAGRQVDLHPLLFDAAGNGWQQLSPSGRAWGCYAADGLAATGSIDGRLVRCLSAELQLRFHLGYEWTDRDEHDIRLLAQALELPMPPPLQNRQVRGAGREPGTTRVSDAASVELRLGTWFALRLSRGSPQREAVRRSQPAGDPAAGS